MANEQAKALLQDPSFWQQPESAQIEKLASIDQDFAKFSPQDRARALKLSEPKYRKTDQPPSIRQKVTKAATDPLISLIGPAMQVGRSVANAAIGTGRLALAGATGIGANELAEGMIQSHVSQAKKAKEAYQKGDYVGATESALGAAIPFYGPLIEESAEKATTGKRPWEAFTDLALAAIPLGGAEETAARRAGTVARVAEEAPKAAPKPPAQPPPLPIRAIPKKVTQPPLKPPSDRAWEVQGPTERGPVRPPVKQQAASATAEPPKASTAQESASVFEQAGPTATEQRLTAQEREAQRQARARESQQSEQAAYKEKLKTYTELFNRQERSRGKQEKARTRDEVSRDVAGAPYMKLPHADRRIIDDLISGKTTQTSTPPLSKAQTGPKPKSPLPAEKASSKEPKVSNNTPATTKPKETPQLKAQQEQPKETQQQTSAPPKSIQQKAQSALRGGAVQETPISDIQVDPRRFQFKSKAIGKGGTTEDLREVEQFDPEKAGVISVWRDPKDGNLYVVNGHHRLELAKRAGYDGPLLTQELKAADAKEARLKGALINIAEGRGEPIDAAKIFREGNMKPEDLKKFGISTQTTLSKQGLSLSKLSEPIFEMAATGDLPEGKAAVIGEMLSNPAQQKSAVELLQKADKRGKHLTDQEFREALRLQVQRAPMERRTEATLFGDIESERSLALELGEISSYIKSQLSSEKRLFGVVGTEGAAQRLSETGNVIKAGENQARAQQASQVQEMYERLSKSSGPVSEALDQAAKELADGEPGRQVKERAYERVREALRADLQALVGGRERGSGGGVSEVNRIGSGSDQSDRPLGLFSTQEPPK